MPFDISPPAEPAAREPLLPTYSEAEMKQRAERASLGERRVRYMFNPGNSSMVADLKRRAAEFINLCEGQAAPRPREQQRLWVLAQTAMEEAAMWAVKAATFDPKEHG